MKETGRCAAAAARAEARPRRVYVGFWTKPRMKARIVRMAESQRRSTSAFIDGIVSDYIGCMMAKGK